MQFILSIIPVALLVTYSQIIVKWRVATLAPLADPSAGLWLRIARFLLDPFILSGYAAALLGSFAWLFVVSRLPLAVAFPIYIGMTFAAVLVCSAVLLHEPLTLNKLAAIGLIIAGVIVGSRT